MRTFRTPFVLRTLLFALVVLAALPARADDALWALLQKGGQIVLVRHAVTDPGVGDPPGFRLDDCKTQRNLSQAGRAEALQLGASLRARGVPVSRVLASPWCRTRETARLAFGREAETEPALSNLFEYGENRDRQFAAFRTLVANAPKQGNVIMVTHGSTTLAFTGVNPATAEMVIVTPTGGGDFTVAGRLPPAR